MLTGMAIVMTVSSCGADAEPPSPEPTSSAAQLTAAPEATATPDPAGAILDACADAPRAEPVGEPIVLAVRTTSSGFDTDRLEGPRHCEPFTITLKNADSFADHNVAIEPMDAIGVQLFAGDLVSYPSTVSYEIPPLPAGEYRFVCSPHRESMRGTLVVSP